MTRMLGDLSLAAACALSVGGMVAAILAARRDSPGLLRQAKRFTYAVWALVTVATLAMCYALLTRDFSVSYVAQVGSHATPDFFTLISLWGALEGSILFWAWVLASYIALAALRTPDDLGPMKGYALAALFGVAIFFNYLLIGPASPFQPVYPVPLDGPGPNPLLQNHWLMAVHPPLLYLGFVGLTVPFAFSIGSLLAGRSDSTWLRLSRSWMIVAWIFLSAAVVAGMAWAYEVLGWGGYWAWDPVENASFLPWLTATAFLHSAMVEERRGMLKLWNHSLIISTFLLTILGTFLTRSGIIASVHAFASGAIGYYFLGFMAIVLIFSLALLAARSTMLESEGQLDSPASRETVFLVNNLLLTAFTFTVLLGTMFPLLAEAARGVKVSVGAPFFNQMTLPLMVALLFLMGVGPALPWRRASAEQLRSKFLIPMAALLLVAAVTLALNPFSLAAVYTAMAFGFGAFALVSNGAEFVTGARARMRAHGENPLLALGRLIGANRHRYGGYLAHIGVVVFAVGIAASSAYRVETERTLRPGETMSFQGYELRLVQLWGAEEPQRFVVGASVAVSKNGRQVAMMDPRMNFYPMSEEPVPTPSVRHRSSDLYLNLMAFERDGSSATLSVLAMPLVLAIWIGGAIIALGALIAVWPGKRRRPPVTVPVQKIRKRRELATTGGD